MEEREREENGLYRVFLKGKMVSFGCGKREFSLEVHSRRRSVVVAIVELWAGHR